MESMFSQVLFLFIGGFLAMAVLFVPYLGLVLTLATQPVVDLLPKIPYVESVAPLIGAVTLAAFLVKTGDGSIRGAFRFKSPHLLAGLLTVWILATHPQAALFETNRNWFFSFVQLWVLLWLGGVLINTPGKHRLLMWAFSLVTLVSAVLAIRRGGFLQEIDPLVRAAGLTDGANTAARYFTVAFVFFFYLRSTSRRFAARLFATLGMAVTFLGVFYTVSRTGMVVLGVALVMLFFMQSRVKYRLQITAVTAGALLVLVITSSSIFSFAGTIAPTITQGTDTMGLRYALWKAGFMMFEDHPVSGVGIGMFPSQLKYYPYENPRYAHHFLNGLVAHNMYVSMLAETGLVGFLLFMALILLPFLNLWKAGRTKDPEVKNLANIWLIVFVVMLLGGLTKTDQIDKLLWLTMGVSVSFHSLAGGKARQPADQPLAEARLQPAARKPVKSGDIR